MAILIKKCNSESETKKSIWCTCTNITFLNLSATIFSNGQKADYSSCKNCHKKLQIKYNPINYLENRTIIKLVTLYVCWDSGSDASFPVQLILKQFTEHICSYLCSINYGEFDKVEMILKWRWNNSQTGGICEKHKHI